MASWVTFNVDSNFQLKVEPPANRHIQVLETCKKLLTAEPSTTYSLPSDQLAKRYPMLVCFTHSGANL